MQIAVHPDPHTGRFDRLEQRGMVLEARQMLFDEHLGPRPEALVELFPRRRQR